MNHLGFGDVSNEVVDLSVDYDVYLPEEEVCNIVIPGSSHS
ncbi:Uncharacterised protein [Mycobacteroides abscessus subsp. abscessus]|nr:Uncharacterised protein [Mycobacteroides abscessus subsp. abscessus]SHX01734.1 Uncharacterised protein [Mycobacteroides abscessus subsp. abscessus]SHX49064.1 Uncharacterised protein [Mycobacteroides abscessus subsp. abscessus]SHZ45419.1 Uncharacterised protein [Mycobacteroides abscessus subsp. abscessus]SHZ48586.1 Uncharacterised protein [Mycobacteroides abscessus subsp. abscessus]